MGDTCSQCKRPSYTMKWSKEKQTYVHFCRQHSPPHCLIEVAELATLRADREALAARVAALRRYIEEFIGPYGPCLVCGPMARSMSHSPECPLSDEYDAALAAPAPGATPERGGTEGGRG